MASQNKAPVTNPFSFARPIRARLIRTGEDVTILSQGDQEGSSIVYHTINAQGLPQDWMPAKEYKITDTNVLPVRTEAEMTPAGGAGR